MPRQPSRGRWSGIPCTVSLRFMRRNTAVSDMSDSGVPARSLGKTSSSGQPECRQSRSRTAAMTMQSGAPGVAFIRVPGTVHVAASMPISCQRMPLDLARAGGGEDCEGKGSRGHALPLHHVGHECPDQSPVEGGVVLDRLDLRGLAKSDPDVRASGPDFTRAQPLLRWHSRGRP